MSFQPFARRKPMAKQAGNQVFILRKSHHAVAQVARRQHVEAPAQPAAGTPIIGDRDHRCQIGDETRSILAVGRRLMG